MLCSCNHYYELYEPPPVLVVSSPQLMVWAKVTPQQHQQHQQHSTAHYTGPGISSPGSSSHRGQPIRSQDAWKLTNQRPDPRELSNEKV